MSNAFNLDNLRAELDKEFAPVVVTLKNDSKVTLRNLFRMTETERSALADMFDEYSELAKTLNDDKHESTSQDKEDLINLTRKIIEALADSPAKGKALVNEMGEDTLLTQRLLTRWMEVTQVGEAEPSPS